MTRSFSDEWDESTAGRAQGDHADDGTSSAPQHVQDDVTALLRQAARDEATMPAEVEARLRQALASEFGGSAFEGSAHGGTSDARPAATRPVDDDVTRPSSGRPAGARVTALPQRGGVNDEITRPARSSGSVNQTSGTPSSVRPAAQEEGATVVSLDGHRNRSRRVRTAALALGAAAAVAIGATTAVQMNKSDDAPVAAKGAAPSSSEGAGGNYASRVRVTQSETKYESASFAKQARALPASKATPVEPVQANAQSLGPLATGEGVQSCLDAVTKGITSMPDKVYADFATYDGAPAVIVVTEKGGNRTAWVVSRTCHASSDLKAGPTSLQT